MEYSIEYGVKGFTLGNGIELTGNTKEYNDLVITNLQEDTEYDVYISEKCINGEVSSEKLTIKTLLLKPLASNDICSSATTLSIGLNNLSISGATSNGNPLNICDEYQSLLDPVQDYEFGGWFTYNSNTNQDVKIEASYNNTFDAYLYIYEGSCNNSTCINSMDDEFILSMEAGKDYFFFATDYNGIKTGEFEMTLEVVTGLTACNEITDLSFTDNGANQTLNWTSINPAIIVIVDKLTDQEIDFVEVDASSESNSVTLNLEEGNYEFVVYNICEDYNSYTPYAIEGTVGESLGVNNIDLDNINIFPNPTNGSINIVGLSNLNSTIEVLSIQGKILNSFTTSNNEIKLNIEGEKGFYFINVKTDTSNKIFKVLKK